LFELNLIDNAVVLLFKKTLKAKPQEQIKTRRNRKYREGESSSWQENVTFPGETIRPQNIVAFAQNREETRVSHKLFFQNQDGDDRRLAARPSFVVL
jgi:hypothetical protein